MTAAGGWTVDLNDSLRRAIAKVCDLPVEEVRPETRLDELGVDSLAVAEVLVELEIELDQELPVHLLRRLDAIGTVGDVGRELEATLAEGDTEGAATSTPPS
jgi:acyl carrier protein